MNKYLKQIQRPKDIVDEKIQEVREKYRSAKEELQNDKRSLINKLKSKIIDQSKETIKDEIGDEINSKLNERIGERITQIEKFFLRKHLNLDMEETREIQKLEEMRENFRKAKKATAAVVMASVIISYCNKMYIKHRKLIHKNCSSLTGSKYTKCMKKQHIISIKQKIAMLRANMKRCDNTSNPKECRKRVQTYTLKMNDKLIQFLKDIAIIDVG